MHSIAETEGGYRTNINISTDTPYLTHTGEPWGAYGEYFREILSH